MKKLLHLYMTILLASVLSFCALFLLPPTSMVEAAENTKQETVVLSKAQYKKSIKMLQQQEQVLIKLKWRIELLETPQSELVTMLEKAESELTNCKQALEKQENSLNSALKSIEQLKMNLKTLEKQISNLEKQNKHRQHQRDVYAAITAILATIIITSLTE